MLMPVDSLRLPAPAKLNLMLRVVGRRADGYHLLQTVFQFIDRCDWITLRARNDGAIILNTPLAGVPADADLTIRAARLLRSEAQSIGAGVEISIEKNLPMGGGLGGGSSDAATTLLGLNLLWDLGFGVSRLAEIGLQLGADVPVFIRGHAAWAEGVGEHLTPLADLPEPWYVVIVPPCQVATGAIFTAPGLTRNNKAITIADFLAGQQENHCLPVVAEMYPQVQEALDALGACAEDAKLTGTGACVFAAFAEERHADQVAESLRQRWQVFVAKGANMSSLHKALGLV